MTCIPNLELKMGVRCLPEGRLERLTTVSRHVAELVNLPPHSADPYVGMSAFAHKGGLHTSALGKAGGATYEHIVPELVGNGTRVLVSDLGMSKEGEIIYMLPREEAAGGVAGKSTPQR